MRICFKKSKTGGGGRCMEVEVFLVYKSQPNVGLRYHTCIILDMKA